MTGELLRMTAPRASAAFAAWPAAIRAPSLVPASPIEDEDTEVAAAMPIAPRADAPRTDVATEGGEIERLAEDIAGKAGTARRWRV